MANEVRLGEGGVRRAMAVDRSVDFGYFVDLVGNAECLAGRGEPHRFIRVARREHRAGYVGRIPAAGDPAERGKGQRKIRSAHRGVCHGNIHSRIGGVLGESYESGGAKPVLCAFAL